MALQHPIRYEQLVELVEQLSEEQQNDLMKRLLTRQAQQRPWLLGCTYSLQSPHHEARDGSANADGNKDLAAGMLKRLYRDLLRYISEDELKSRFYAN